MKLKLTLLVFFLTTCVFAQTQGSAMFTLCGKECNGNVTFEKDQFNKCDKMLRPIFEGDKIISFVLSMVVNGQYTDFQVNGNLSPDECRLISAMGVGSKIIIEKVKIFHNNKTVSAPGVVITFK